MVRNKELLETNQQDLFVKEEIGEETNIYKNFLYQPNELK